MSCYWLRALKMMKRAQRRGSRRQLRGKPSSMEALEARMLLSGATIYTVNSASSSISGTGNSGTLPYVIGQANSDPNPAGSEIEFDPTVFATSTPQTITLVRTLELSETAGPELIDGPGATVLTVNSNDDSPIRVFLIDKGVAATLGGLTIANGVAQIEDDESAIDSSGDGGGVFNNGGTLTVENCTVTNNFADENGGGIYNSGTLTLVGSTITENRGASDADGGGVYNSGGNVQVTNCQFTGNTAQGNGGGIFNSKGTMAINGSTIDDNTSTDGGGIFVSTGTVTINGSTLNGNSASEDVGEEDTSEGSGGGLYNSSGSVHLTNCNVSSNSARSPGGGIVCMAGTMAVNGDTISNNTAANGGGIYIGSGVLTIKNSTLSANSAGTYGGGIAENGTLTVINSTISGNTAGFGGGIWTDGILTAVNVTIVHNQSVAGPGAGGGLDVFDDDEDGRPASSTSVVLDNTIIALNTGSTSSQLVAEDIAGSVSGSFDLIGTGGSGGLTDTDGNQVGVSDLFLGTLRINGGNTATIALLPGSPAIGAGSNEISGVTVPCKDQRGVARPSDSVDIGAFQDQGFTITILEGAGTQSTKVNTPFDNALSVEVTSAAGDPVMGGVVNFLAPSSGASASLSEQTAVISCRGDAASVTATANGAAGSYNVTAMVAGATSPAIFSLTNNPTVPVKVPSLQGSTTSVVSSADPSIAGKSVIITATVALDCRNRYADRNGHLHD